MAMLQRIANVRHTTSGFETSHHVVLTMARRRTSTAPSMPIVKILESDLNGEGSEYVDRYSKAKLRVERR